MLNLVKPVIDWNHFYAYLSGAIDFDPTGGAGWRSEWSYDLVTEFSFKLELILNPTKKPYTGSKYDVDNEAHLINEARQRKDWDGLVEVVDQIAHIDLRMTDRADIVFVNFPNDKKGNKVFTVGTIHEIVEARRQRKPVMAVWEGGKETASGWLMWLIGHQNVFSTWKDLKEHFRKILNGEVAYNVKDWLFFDFSKTHKERKV